MALDPLAPPPERLIVGHTIEGHPVRQMKNGRRYAMTPNGAVEMDGVDGPDSRDIAPRGFLEMFGPRFVAKNLAASPDRARAYFERLGFETKRYGRGWNFAYRKRNDENDSWQVLDPEGLDVGDFFDIISDALIGVGSGVTATLGALGGAGLASIPGAMAGGAIGAAGLEAIKQGIGEAAGVPDNYDPAAVGIAGAGGAGGAALSALGGMAVRGTGRLLGGLVKTADRHVPQIAAKLIGAKPLGEELTAGGVLMEGLRLTKSGTVPLMTPYKAGLVMRSAVRYTNAKGGLGGRIPQVVMADAAIEDASRASISANLAPAMQEIQKYALVPSGTRVVTKETAARTITKSGSAERKGSVLDLLADEPEPRPFHKVSELEWGVTIKDPTTTVTTEPTFAPGATPEIQVARGVSESLPSDATKLIDHIRTQTGYFGPWEETPIQTAWTIKRILQGIARGEGANKMAGPSEVYGRMVNSAAGRTRIAVSQTMEANGYSGFRPLMHLADKKARLLKFWEEALRTSDRTPIGEKAAENVVEGLYGEGGTAYLTALHQFARRFHEGQESQFIQKAVAGIRSASIGRALGARGLGGELPILTAVGGFRGPAMLAGGYATAGPVGMVAGGLLGSPRVMMRFTGPGAQKLSGAAAGVAGRMAQLSLGSTNRIMSQGALTTAQISVLRATIAAEGSGSKGVSRQDEGKKRRVIFVGGQ